MFIFAISSSTPMFNVLISLGVLGCWWETGEQQINFASFYNSPTKLDFSHTKVKTAWGLKHYKCIIVCRIRTQSKTYCLLNGFATSVLNIMKSSQAQE